MLIYRAAFKSQIVADLGDGLGEGVLVDPKVAIRNAMSLAREWQDKAGCDSSVLVLSAVKSDSFRHRLWPTYKQGRAPSKPEAYAAIREALVFEMEVMEEPGLEADDLLGIHGTADPNSVIVSGDKDMKTLPANVINPMHDRKPQRIKPGVADQMWMKQTMIGDAVDNYPGIRGVGEKIAQEILLAPHRLRKTITYVGKRNPKPVEKWVKGEPCTLWQCMTDYAARAGMTEDDLVVMAQVARILRHDDYDPASRTVRLWTPGGYKELSL